MLFCANPFQPNIAFYVETNHLIFTPNQMTGFYMEFNTGLKWVNIDKGILSEKDFVYLVSANTTEWSNTQTIRRLLPANCLSVFDPFVGLALKGLIISLSTSL